MEQRQPVKAMRPIRQGREVEFSLHHWHFHRPEFWDLFAGLKKDAVIVEAAPGKGAVANKLLELGFQDIHLLDIEDHRMFEPVKKLPLALADLGRDTFPFPDKSVDVVVALEIIEHLENPWLFAREIHRVLKPDGMLILSFPMPWNLISRLLFLKKGKFENYGSFHPQHIWAPIQEVFDFCLRYFKKDTEKTFYDRRTRFHFGGFSLKWNFPANERWGMHVCYVFRNS